MNPIVYKKLTNLVMLQTLNPCGAKERTVLMSPLKSLNSARKERLHTEVALDVFKARNPALVIAVKNFLKVLPTPQAIEEVLKEATYELAEVDPESCRWLVQNSLLLMPELDLRAEACTWAVQKLKACGFEEGPDFHQESRRRLQLSEVAKSQLQIGNSVLEELMLEELLSCSGSKLDDLSEQEGCTPRGS
ncbi:hypothetical protein NG796_23355 [Laspinema sp. A4]|uniref:hypothetical protein n=1 Tax=Laspinema sp. D2d TaxID=2953686 RepID=UPI0021BA6103|nr:hypothetical protein [Laspinema sp. D2d]MCT7986215.1 hypothetical protein [Laspinema sp. D2d]